MVAHFALPFPGPLLHHRWAAALFAAVRVLLVVPGGSGAVPSAEGSVRGTQLQEEVFLPLRLLCARAGGGRVGSHRLQRIRFKNGVS